LEREEKKGRLKLLSSAIAASLNKDWFFDFHPQGTRGAPQTIAIPTRCRSSRVFCKKRGILP
jgi:hypothetical protein